MEKTNPIKKNQRYKNMATIFYAPVRMSKVLEGRAKIKDLEGCTINQKLIHLFHDVITIDDGYSVKEIALILFPNEIQNNDPDEKMIARTQIIMSNFRTSQTENGGKVIVYAMRDPEHRYWIYYNIESNKDSQNIRHRLTDTLLKNLDTLNEVTLMSKKERHRLNKLVLQAVWQELQRKGIFKKENNKQRKKVKVE